MKRINNLSIFIWILFLGLVASSSAIAQSDDIYYDPDLSDYDYVDDAFDDDDYYDEDLEVRRVRRFCRTFFITSLVYHQLHHDWYRYWDNYHYRKYRRWVWYNNLFHFHHHHHHFNGYWGNPYPYHHGPWNYYGYGHHHHGPYYGPSWYNPNTGYWYGKQSDSNAGQASTSVSIGNSNNTPSGCPSNQTAQSTPVNTSQTNNTPEVISIGGPKGSGRTVTSGPTIITQQNSSTPNECEQQPQEEFPVVSSPDNPNTSSNSPSNQPELSSQPVKSSLNNSGLGGRTISVGKPSQHETTTVEMIRPSTHTKPNMTIKPDSNTSSKPKGSSHIKTRPSSKPKENSQIKTRPSKPKSNFGSVKKNTTKRPSSSTSKSRSYSKPKSRSTSPSRTSSRSSNSSRSKSTTTSRSFSKKKR